MLSNCSFGIGLHLPDELIFFIFFCKALGIGIFTGGSHLFLNGIVLGVIYYGGVLMSR